MKTPDTPACRLLAGWLGTLGTGKPEALERFITENYSKDVLARGTARQRAAGGIQLYQDNGGARSWPESSVSRPTNSSPWPSSR